MRERCAILPPSFEPLLANGEPCPLPNDGHLDHRTSTPDGKTWEWNGFDCAYPEECQYDGDAECCVTYGEVDSATSPSSRLSRKETNDG